MKITFTFQGIERTQAIEDHISKKLLKLDEFIKAEPQPKNVNVHIKKDASVKIELLLTTKNFHLDAHSIDYDLYAATDDAVVKLITQAKKQRSKMLDKQRHQGADKRSITPSINLDDADLAAAALGLSNVDDEYED